MTVVHQAADTGFLDAARDTLLRNDIQFGMSRLRTVLGGLRAALPTESWNDVAEHVRRHDVHGLLLESPFTLRAFAKPRGYAGDADLIDLIYGDAPRARTLSPLGARLHDYEFDSACFQSIRARRAVLAREIDDVAATRTGAHVLSVGCGYLREIEWSRAVCENRVSMTAIDEDPYSVAGVKDRYGDFDIQAIPLSIRDLVRRSPWVGDVDLAYAAGLYDSLEDDIARLLTTVLFRTLRPGGRMLIANFTPATDDAAFMESVMDWHLVYRSPSQLRALAASIPAGCIERIDQFSSPNGHIGYLRIVRR
jgi:SAM-dependent methyltransferase